MGTWSLVISLLLCVTVLTNAQDASRARPPRRSTSLDHLDKLSRDELLDILGKIEDSAAGSKDKKKTSTAPTKAPVPDYSSGTSGKNNNLYPPVTAPPRRKYTTPEPSAPRFPTTRRPIPTSSDIDALINKYKNRKGQPGSPTVDDLLRRLRTNRPSAPSAPASTFNYPGPNFASNSRYPSSSSSSSSSSRGSLPYPTSYNSALFPTKSPSYPSYPSSYGNSYPTSYGSPSYNAGSPYGGASYPTSPGSRLYPSLPSNGYSGGYSPSGSFGGVAPKYVTTTKKPKKGFFSKIFG